MIQEYQFGEWLPDAPAYGVDGLEECLGMVHQSDGYAPYPIGESISYTGTISGTVIGADTFYQTDGTPVLVIGTTSDLYFIEGGAANASSLSLSLSASDTWQFERFGSSIYATNKTAGLHRLADIDSNTTFSSVTAPKAKCIARIGDFLVLGNLDDGGTDYPYRVQWSPYNNPTGTWGTDIATQAGYVDMMERYGEVTALSDGEVAVIFQEHGASRMTPGGVAAFDKEIIDEGRGCVGPSAIAEHGGRTFFIGSDGVYVFDGGGTQDISSGKIWKTFTGEADIADVRKFSLSIDWARRALILAAKKAGEAKTIVYAYSLDTGWWSKPLGSMTQSVVFETRADATSQRVTGTVFISSAAISTFSDETGVLSLVQMTTKRFQPNPRGRSQVNGFWLLSDSAGLTPSITISAFDGSLDDTATTDMENGRDYTPIVLDGRQFSVTISFFSIGSASDPRIFGFQLDSVESGMY